jgi:hypothetical protein
MSEIDYLERISAAGAGRDLAKERREDREAMELLDWIEDSDVEDAFDRVEQVLVGWKDDRGLPREGFESPRFLSPRQKAYVEWIQSEAGARTRQVVHPNLEERIQRGVWDAEDRARSYDEVR